MTQENKSSWDIFGFLLQFPIPVQINGSSKYGGQVRDFCFPIEFVSVVIV
jgi:hypothetical protein